MSNPSGFDFTKFVPGFDFLKNLTPGAGAASTAAPGWVAPTLDPQELDKRIQELKTVHFWLDQNTKAVSATIQALEVQRMTLATLQGMNLSFSELAESLKVKPQPDATPTAPEPAPASEPAPEQAAAQQAAKAAKPQSKPTASASAGVDPAHWWSSLTDQFQHIANKAMHDMAHNAAAHAGAPAKKAAAPSAPAKPKAARKTTRQTASKATGKATAKTAARRKA